MSISKHLSRLPIAPLLLLLLVCPARARAQSSIPQELIESRLNLSQLLDRLVERNAERADALQKFQGRRVYSLVYTGFPSSFHAEMVVNMTYDAPATKEFKIISQSGSQWIIDRILKRLLDAELESMSEENRKGGALSPRNYDFSSLERQDTPDSCSYVVAV
jgi:hypothetical protein